MKLYTHAPGQWASLRCNTLGCAPLASRHSTGGTSYRAAVASNALAVSAVPLWLPAELADAAVNLLPPVGTRDHGSWPDRYCSLDSRAGSSGCQCSPAPR